MIRVIIFMLFALPVSAAIVVVGPLEKIKSVKSGLALVRPGDTLMIQAGVYREGNILVRQPVTILGNGFPTLDGEGEYEIMTVTASGVTISGIHFFDTGIASMEDLAAIRLMGVSNVRVMNNHLEKTFFGIHVSNSTNCWIEGNHLISNKKAEFQIGNGIHLWRCDHMTIAGNEIQGHRDGIYFEFVTQSIVQNNLSRQNMRYGLHFMFSNDDEYTNNVFRNNGAGVAVMYTKGVKMIGNHFDDNRGPSSYGLLLKDIRDSFIEKNTFAGNSIGIYMEGCSRSLFDGNVFRQNGWALRIQASCDGNTFTRNNFMENSFDVATNGSISLNKIEHNYWDKYEGYDLNRDGIGDVPFHPVSLYGMIVEKMPTAVILWRSLMVVLLDKAEKVMPVVTPENLADGSPLMKQI